MKPETSSGIPAPWHGRTVPWAIDGETFVAQYNPSEAVIMRVAKDRGASRKELETVHLLKALLGAVIVDAEAAA